MLKTSTWDGEKLSMVTYPLIGKSCKNKLYAKFWKQNQCGKYFNSKCPLLCLIVKTTLIRIWIQRILKYEPVHESMCDQQSLRSDCTYAQSDQSLCLSLEYSRIVKLLIEHHLEFLSLKRGCRGSSESKLVKITHCWKSHAMAHISLLFNKACER